MFTFSFQVYFMRFFRGSVVTKPLSFFANRNTCSPFVLIPNNSKKSRFISSIWPLNILRIAIGQNNTKIAQSIVIFAPVDMINQPIRPLAIRMQPRQTMGFVNFLFNAYRNVAKFVSVTCNIANMNCFGRAASPSKRTSYLVIREHFAQLFYCKIGSHMKSPFFMVNVYAEIIA